MMNREVCWRHEWMDEKKKRFEKAERRRKFIRNVICFIIGVPIFWILIIAISVFQRKGASDIVAYVKTVTFEVERFFSGYIN